jgi:tryptophan synthase beta chain
MNNKFFFPAVPGQSPNVNGYFGAFGGKFIPEALVAAVDEVAVEYDKAKADPTFAAELEQLLADYVGRPSALTEVPRFAEHAGSARVFLKREDLNHTGSHKINNVLGQALLTKRMGKPRVIAETGAGQHGVATATACALFGLECTIYMGEIDVRRQAVNVARMKMLGATVIPVTSGCRTLKDAINETFRDWVGNVETTHYIFGTVAGPHPFPAMIRDFQRVIGVEARRQILERTGRLPDSVVACVGGGSNAIGLFHAFLPDAGVRLIGCEAGGRGAGIGQHAATLSAGEPGILHGSRSYVLQDDEGQITEPWSISAGLDYPGVGPEHAYLHDTGRGEYRPVTDAAAMRAFRLLVSSEGIVPAIESAHALAGAIEVGTELGPAGLILVGLSGRGDKDLDIATRYFEQDADAARTGGCRSERKPPASR